MRARLRIRDAFDFAFRVLVLGVVAFFGFAATASTFDICQEQLRAHQVPVACFVHFNRFGRTSLQAANSDVWELLNRRCEASVRRLHQIDTVAELFRHPDLSTECRQAVEQQLQKLRYRHEESHPWEVVESYVKPE